MVRPERLELSSLAALEPKSSASTNSATLAYIWYTYGESNPVLLRARQVCSQVYQQPKLVISHQHHLALT